MQFQTTAVVKAMKPSKGELDNGRKYDSTKVYIETAFDAASEGFGSPTIEYTWGLSDNYYEFIQSTGIKEPFEAQITWENQTTGKRAQLAVVDIKPLKQTKQAS